MDADIIADFIFAYIYRADDTTTSESGAGLLLGRILPRRWRAYGMYADAMPIFTSAAA